jgi:mono/diheme cytochrome c family protein
VWHRLFFALLVLLVFVLLTRAQTAKTPESPRVPIEGNHIYQQYCASCHGADGRGQGPAAAKLRETVPDLTQLTRSNGGIFPAEYVRDVIEGSLSRVRAGHDREMPAWGPVFHRLEWDQDLGEIRLDAIRDYVASIQKK